MSTDIISADASVRLYLPPRLAENEITKYPMLVHVYGGPGSQQVNERFQVGWGHHLATSKNVIYCLIDGRGSGFKGEKMLFELYHRLGTVEVEDQIQVTRYEAAGRVNRSNDARTTGDSRNDFLSLTGRTPASGDGVMVAT